VAHFARELGGSFEIAEATIRVNDRQRLRMVEKIAGMLGGDLHGKTVAILGLSFKPETDDMRDAPSIDIIQGLQEQGAVVRACDPRALDAALELLPDVVPCDDAYEACDGADVLVIMTEWNQYRMLDLARVKELLTQPRMVDLRNVYEPESARAAGFTYVSIGR
jgi:UDPglucose 6-dehydrogenase